MRGSDAKPFGTHRHPFVVGDDNRQVPPQFEGSREMNRIERPEVCRVKLTSSIEDAVVDSNEIEPLQDAPAPCYRFGTPRQEGAKNFGAGQRARY